MVDELERAGCIQGDGRAVDGLAVRVVAQADDLRVFGVVDIEGEVVAGHDPVQRRGDELAEGDLRGGDLAHQLLHGLALERGGERRYLRLEAVGELEYLEGFLVVVCHQLDDMGEGAVTAFVDIVFT